MEKRDLKLTNNPKSSSVATSVIDQAIQQGLNPSNATDIAIAGWLLKVLNGEASFEDFLTGLSTGGYTGDWGENGKLGILHEKELVLNAKDTENILSAVHIMRSLSDTLFANIGKDLDERAAAAYALLGSSFSALTTSIPAGDTNKTMVIENVNFPNAIYANEIEEAINNLINHAEQYASGGV